MSWSSGGRHGGTCASCGAFLAVFSANLSFFTYILTIICASRPAAALPDAIEAKKAINAALGSAFGLTGSAVPVDVLQWDSSRGRGILRVPSTCVLFGCVCVLHLTRRVCRSARGVWGAMSLQSSMGGRGEIAWHVESASAHLVNLAVDRQLC